MPTDPLTLYAALFAERPEARPKWNQHTDHVLTLWTETDWAWLSPSESPPPKYCHPFDALAHCRSWLAMELAEKGLFVSGRRGHRWWRRLTKNVTLKHDSFDEFMIASWLAANPKEAE